MYCYTHTPPITHTHTHTHAAWWHVECFYWLQYQLQGGVGCFSRSESAQSDQLEVVSGNKGRGDESCSRNDIWFHADTDSFSLSLLYNWRFVCLLSLYMHDSIIRAIIIIVEPKYLPLLYTYSERRSIFNITEDWRLSQNINVVLECNGVHELEEGRLCWHCNVYD